MHTLKNVSVVIIGAGAAGIAAATRLLENGFTDFIILEAQHRIGGRIFSVNFGDSFIDLGAQWCHGEKGNVVYELVKDLNILKQSLKFSAILHSESKLDPSDVKSLYELYEKISDGEGSANEGVSRGEFFLKRYNECIENRYVDNLKLKQIALDASDMFLHYMASQDGCLSIFDASAVTDYKECDGDQAISWNGRGFKTILDVLMKKYPNPTESLPIDDKILLNKEVTEINWNNSPDVNSTKLLIHCSDDTTYCADHVIVSVSLGVLKERAKALFNPALPLPKIKAIEDAGFGAVMKIFVWFSEKWWPDDFRDFGLVWSNEDRQKLIEEKRSWILDIFAFIPIDNNPNVLCFWLAGENIPQIELIPDDTISSTLMFILKKFVGDQFNITQPEKILRSNWFSHPHFRGTYSYESLKGRTHKVSIQKELSEPLLSSMNQRPIILFAGEATHPKYFSTVHGAVETGYREADRILEFHRKEHELL